MKKIALLFTVMMLSMVANAQTALDVQNSGCLNETRGEETQRVPTIVLTKEGSVLSVQLLNYECDCCTLDFIVTSNISGGNNGDPCLVSINVSPVEEGCDCICPYNLSFTIRDLEPNSFFLNCWWYNGLVELAEGQSYQATEGGSFYAYHPFLKEGKTWNYREYYHNTWNDNYWTKEVSYVINGTTEIDGKVYYKLYRISEDGNNYYCALREEDKKVWQYTSSEGEHLLYDFGMSIGDSYKLFNLNYYYQLTSIKPTRFHDDQLLNVLYYDIYVRYYSPEPAMEKFASAPIVEGVGCEEGWKIMDLYAPQPTNGISHGEQFLSCYEDGKCIFTADDFNNLAADDDNYYYYQGNKIPLTLNENKVVVSVLKADKEVSERILANIQILGSIKDETYDIYVITRSEYEKLTTLDFWTVDAKSAILTSSYFTEDNEEVFETPYLNVKLKKEEDADLLDFYAEENKLVNLGSFSQQLPLWYVLYVTPESEKSPLECANELYESGNYASSVPDLADAIMPQPQLTYRPFIEEGKVWKVGGGGSVNPVQLVEYYYFEGDTIVGGKTCKQMMRQRFVTPDYPDYDVISQYPSLSKVGAWYEEDKKVYFYNENTQSMRLMYDFSLGANETLLIDNVYSYIIGPKQTGGMEGFKGVYRDVMWCSDNGSNSYCTTWLEGVGGIDGPLTNIYYGEENHALPLMSCTVGDEVIYLNDEYEDGATPQVLLARKNRFDFTHTIKTRPRLPRNNVSGDAETSGMDDAEESEDLSIYGEYSTLQLDINLDPLADAYQVRITNASGQVVYEKTINAGSIVALSIDISAYAKGRYTVTVENSYESFTGEFDTLTTGIEAIRNNKEVKSTEIYNLHGQRLSSLQKGLNIVNGQKVFVK